MKYYIIQPEVAGGLGEKTVINPSVHPPEISVLHYKFDGWLGDVLLETFPCFIITSEVAKKLKESLATGIKLDDVYVEKSDLFDEIYPQRILPPFKWLKVIGDAGKDDFGLSSKHCLVISDRMFKLLKLFGLSNALVEDFQS